MERFDAMHHAREEGASWSEIAFIKGFDSAHAARSWYHYHKEKYGAATRELILVDDFVEDTLTTKTSKFYYIRDEAGFVTAMVTLLRDGPIEVPYATHKAMRAAYSDWDGDRQTLNQVAKNFGITRAQMVQYKTIHGWTHDVDPYVDEEIMSADIDDLASNIIQQQRKKLEVRVGRLQEAEDRADAKKWRDLAAGLYKPFRDLATHIEIRDVPKVVMFRTPSRSERELVINASDWQIGEIAQRSELMRNKPYDLKIAQAALTQYMEKIAEHINNSMYKYNRLVIADVGDLGHGLDGFTAGGTQLEVGAYRQEQVHVILNLMHQLIQQARSLAPQVDVIHVEGNHLGYNSTLVFDQIAAWYGGDNPAPDVTVHHNYKGVEVMPVGEKSLLVYYHGKTGGPGRAIPQAGPGRERAGYWLIMDAIRRYPERTNVHLITGHNHSLKLEEFSDFTMHQLGSVAGGSSRYADDLLLKGRATQSILEVNVEDGLVWPIPILVEV